MNNSTILNDEKINTESKRFDYFDGLRVVCAILIVLIHSTSVMFYSDMLSDSVWWFMNITNSFSRVGVSIFFMISGALLLKSSKNDSIEYVFFKRVVKIVIQLIIFSVIYAYLYGVIIDDTNFTIKSFIRRFLTNDIENKFWFLYVLIGLYLSTPLLRIIVEKASRKYLWYFVILSLVGVYFKYDMNTYFDINVRFEIPIVASYLGVYVLGYLLNTTDIPKNYRIIIYVLGILGYIFRVWSVYNGTLADGHLNIDWINNHTFNVLVSSVAIFVFAKNAPSFERFSKLKIIREISKITLGVYLIHPAIIKWFVFWREWKPGNVEIHHIVALFVIATVGSMAISFVLSKIKYVNKLIS